ncbi:cytochrome c family protein [Hyphomonadaceae bacterium ML37]|nr:cytochrome c family protein [Hyphomonadaceae bacterium ML37]
MGDLFFNKVAGVILAVALFMMALGELSNIVFGGGDNAELAYPIDLSALQTSAPAAEEPSGPVDFGVLLASADLSAGERVARRCAACHTFNEGGANGTGPNLWGVMGRGVAEVAGFNYSGAMTEYGSGGTRWLFENMYEYLENPRGYVPGTSMSFAGLRSQDDRINVIAYMRSQDNDPLALPDPLAEAAAGEDDVADAEAEAAANSQEVMPDPAEDAAEDAGEAPADEEAPSEDDAEAEPADEDGGEL